MPEEALDYAWRSIRLCKFEKIVKQEEQDYKDVEARAAWARA